MIYIYFLYILRGGRVLLKMSIFQNVFTFSIYPKSTGKAPIPRSLGEFRSKSWLRSPQSEGNFDEAYRNMVIFTTITWLQQRSRSHTMQSRLSRPPPLPPCQSSLTFSDSVGGTITTGPTSFYERYICSAPFRNNCHTTFPDPFSPCQSLENATPFCHRSINCHHFIRVFVYTIVDRIEWKDLTQLYLRFNCNETCIIYTKLYKVACFR